jgi:hypothetical protein
MATGATDRWLVLTVSRSLGLQIYSSHCGQVVFVLAWNPFCSVQKRICALSRALQFTEVINNVCYGIILSIPVASMLAGKPCIGLSEGPFDEKRPAGSN